MIDASELTLRRATSADAEPLHGLLCIPAVYRYLTDGAAAPRSAVEEWIERSHADFEAHGVGMWLLEEAHGSLAGCVRLEMQAQRSAELIYVLHPQFWGSGLATRMSWTVIQEAFGSGNIDQVVAGADGPNTASVAVMRRLGMHFLRSVRYPAGAGVEYVLRRGDRPPVPLPEVIPLRAPSSGK